LVFDRETGHVLALNGVAAAALNQCQSSRSFEAHLTTAWQSGASADPMTLVEQMQALRDLQLLRPLRLPQKASPWLTDVDVSAIAVISADRPRMLRRALKSLSRNIKHRSATIIVVDGSTHARAESASAVREISEDVETKIEYMGVGEAAEFRRALQARGIPQNVLTNALSPGTIGCNRNLATLVTAGKTVLMQDDDVVCEPWLNGQRKAGVILAGHSDLRSWRFFRSRAEALESVTPTALDILAAHEVALSRTLSSILSINPEGTSVESACGHMLAATDGVKERIVRVTFSGLAGDGGRYCSHGILFRQGRLQRQFWHDQEECACALESREITCVANQLILTHETACLAYCMGVDNTSLTPPFMPIGRNEDGVWGATLGFMDQRALFAHLPHGVVHDSSRSAAFDIPMVSARQSRIADLFLFVISRHARSVLVDAPEERLRRLGQLLIDVSELSRSDFLALIAEARLSTLCNELAQAEATMASTPECTTHWGDAIRDYRRVLLEHAVRPDFLVPFEAPRASTSGGVDEARTYARDFGELLLWWPEIWKVARELNERVGQ
jgi:hypothetical protein